MTRVIEWRCNPVGVSRIRVFEAYIDDRIVGWIARRPHYCDRGHWQAQIELGGLDRADCFPRYFMRFSTAKQEMEEFIRWRLWKERIVEFVRLDVTEEYTYDDDASRTDAETT